MTALTYDNPRQDVPSCSALYRLENCPASFHLSRGYPEQDNPDAASGRRVHKWLESQAPVFRGNSALELTDDELEVAALCWEQACALIADLDFTTFANFAETRLGLSMHGSVTTAIEKSNVPFVLTGQADLIVFDGRTTALVIDYKTGRGEQQQAKDNRQLMGLAGMVGQWTGAERVYVAIVQPLAGPPSVAQYDGDALRLAKSWAISVAHDALTADHAGIPPRAGDWCKYCRHLANCSAVQNTVANAVTATACAVPLPPDDKGAKLAIQQRAKQLTPEQLGTALDGLKLVEWYAAAIKAAAKDNPPPGWGLKEGNTMRTVTNIKEAVTRLYSSDPNGDDYVDAFSISLPALETIFRNRSDKDAKGRPTLSKSDARDLVEEALGDLIEYTTAAPKLVRVGAIEDGEEDNAKCAGTDASDKML